MITRRDGRRWFPITEKIGCAPQTLHEWLKKVEVDSGKRAGVLTEVADKLKALERENREPRQANDPAQGAAHFCSGGARPPVQAMSDFIDEHCEAYGVEPICKALPIAPIHLSQARRTAAGCYAPVGSGSLIEIGKLNRVDPQAYLTDTLKRLANGHRINALADLMP